MTVLALTQESARPEIGPPSARASWFDERVPLDFLVNALNRAVVRKQSAENVETEHWT
jgi:hypothetical protein